MKITMISHTEGNSRLLLVFAGWSTRPDFYAPLSVAGWDIAIVHDYTGLTFDYSLLRDYGSVYVLAWSLGVVAAESAAAQLPEDIRIAAAFAVNGTTRPLSDTYGIPHDIYHGTERTLNLRNLLKFRRRMSSRRDLYAFPQDPDTFTEDDIAPLRSELRILAGAESEERLPWRRAYISENDLIFPAQNQRAAWETHPAQPQIVTVPAGHYIPLDRIISDILPNHEKIARGFRRASESYDANAVAQQRIAERLADMIPEEMTHRRVEIVEIGAGSGLLSRRLNRLQHIASATFIDLYPTPEFGIAPVEEYLRCDAEEWIAKVDDKSFDAIFSASTIQWFADAALFFANAARALREDGELICSTFVAGNLGELDALRPSPLLYHTEDEIRAMLEPYFRDIELETEEIRVEFPDAAALLRHLRATGVTGAYTPGGALSPAAIRTYLRTLPDHPALTYRPLFIRARRGNVEC